MSPLRRAAPPERVSATCRRGVEGEVGVTPGSSRESGHERGEALVRVERPRLEEEARVGLPAERLHGAGEHVPVEHLLLARLLDRGEGRLAPRLVVADLERLVE